MNIAITVTEPSLDANVDPRFGRCPYFLIVDTDSLKFEAIENPNLTLGGGAGIQSAQLMAEKNVKQILTGSCGPNAYQTLSAAGIDVIISCSGLVRDVIEQYKAGQLSTVNEPNVASHSGMNNQPINPNPNQPTNPQSTGSEIGMGQGQGAGMGRGMGQGQGAGMGRGMGQGQGAGMGRGGGAGMGRGGGAGMGRGGGAGMGRGGGAGMGQGSAFSQEPASIPQQPSQNLTKNNELDMLKQQAEIINHQMRQIQERIEQLEKED